MVFLLIAVNLAIYLAAFYLFQSGRVILGVLTLVCGVVTTCISILIYKFKKFLDKPPKPNPLLKYIPECKYFPDCDCFPDCDGPDCGCG